MTKARESALAHQLLDGLRGIEIGPATYNPFGLNTRNVGLRHAGWERDQIERTGDFAPIHYETTGELIPVPDESEDFVISSHVIEHVPDLIRTLLEWYRVVKPGGYIYAIVPLRDASPTDRDRPISGWDHIFEDFLRRVGPDDDPEIGVFGICHYHVFTLASLKLILRRVFGDRIEVMAVQEKDDKVGNGFTVACRKRRALAEAFPWVIEGGGRTAEIVIGPADADGQRRLGHAGPLPRESPFPADAARQAALDRYLERLGGGSDAATHALPLLRVPWPDKIHGSGAAPTVPAFASTAELFAAAAEGAANQGAEWFGVVADDTLLLPEFFAAWREAREQGRDALVVSARRVTDLDADGKPVPAEAAPDAVDALVFRLSWWRTWKPFFKAYDPQGLFWPQACAAVCASHGNAAFRYGPPALLRLSGTRSRCPGERGEKACAADAANIALYCRPGSPDKAYNVLFLAYVETARALRLGAMPPAGLDKLVAARFRLAVKPWEGDRRPRVNICLRSTGEVQSARPLLEAILGDTTYPFDLTVIAPAASPDLLACLGEHYAARRIKHLIATPPIDDIAACRLAIAREPGAGYFALALGNAATGPGWLERLVAMADALPQGGAPEASEDGWVVCKLA